LVPKVNIIHAWDFAYRNARKGPWEEMARDHARFQNRICCLGKTLAPILDGNHRKEIYGQRFSSSLDDHKTS
jgi:hypothetical protein